MKFLSNRRYTIAEIQAICKKRAEEGRNKNGNGSSKAYRDFMSTRVVPEGGDNK